MCEEEITKIKDINDLNVIEVGLICSSGFDFIKKNIELINGKELYEAPKPHYD